MNSAIFGKTYRFYKYKFYKYHYTDNRRGAPDHYIAYMCRGKSRLVSKTGTVEINEGDIFYIPLGLPYQSYWYGEPEIEFISLGFEFFPESENADFCLQKIDCDQILKDSIRSIAVNTGINSETLGDFYTVLNFLLPYMEREVKNDRSETLTKAVNCIKENPNASVREIARLCGISESTLYALFRSQLGKTPNDTRLEILCEKAVFLLTTTDKSVQEISDDLGFSSTSYFRKILKKYTSQIPREIRKNRVYTL